MTSEPNNQPPWWARLTVAKTVVIGVLFLLYLYAPRFLDIYERSLICEGELPAWHEPPGPLRSSPPLSSPPQP